MSRSRRISTTLRDEARGTMEAKQDAIQNSPDRTPVKDTELTKAREALAALQELRKQQSWNPIVRAATDLLSDESALKRWSPEVLHYHYSECPLVDGRWYRPEMAPTTFWKLSTGLERDDALGNYEAGPVPLGVVLENVFEVAIRDSWSQGNKQKERLIPVAILEPGALFGAFEFCDLLDSAPSLRNYEVSAGSRAFKIVPRNRKELRDNKGFLHALLRSYPDLTALKEKKKKTLRGILDDIKASDPELVPWLNGVAEHDALIRYLKLHSAWTAKIVLLRRTPVPISRGARDFLDIVQNVAWQQSRHLREGHLKWLRHDFVPDNIDARSLLLMGVSKFKRKLELAVAEERMVFGHPGETDGRRLQHYGPLVDLAGKISNTGIDINDLLVPVALHEFSQPAYASLWDDACIFAKSGEYRQTKSLVDSVISSFPNSLKRTVRIESRVLAVSTNVDPFWKGAVELTPKFCSLPCLEAVKPKTADGQFMSVSALFDGGANAVFDGQGAW